MHRSLGLGGVLAVSIALACFLLSAVPAGASHVQCGDLITQNTTLDSDLLDCPGDGLVLADGVRLNLNGHTVDGDDGGDTDTAGIRAHRGVIVRNGTVTADFGTAVDLFEPGSDGNTLRDLRLGAGLGAVTVRGDGNDLRRLTITTGGELGVRVTGAQNVVRKISLNGAFDIPLWAEGSRNTVAHNSITPQGYCGGAIQLENFDRGSVSDNFVESCFAGSGIVVSAAGRVQVERNHVEDSYFDGIIVNAGAGSLVSRNTALHNGLGEDGNGITIATPGIKVERNVANDNFDLGIEAIPGTIDGGGNRASGNGNPAQCTGVTCTP